MATDTDAQAWIDDVVLDGGIVRDETAIDNLVIKLKNDGVWSKIDRLWLRKYAGSEISALKCLKTLIDSVNFGSTFDDDQGFIGDGVDDFIETKARIQSYTNFTQNGAHYAVKFKDGDGLGSSEESGNVTTYIGIASSGGFSQYRINSGDISTAISVNDGFLVAVRTGASAHQLYHNGAEVHSGTVASISPSGGDFGSLARNGNDFSINTNNAESFIGGTEEVVSIGGALTATDVSNLNDAIQDFYTEVETPAGTTISGITQKDGVTLVADGTYVQHLYADDNKGTNETELEVGQTTGGEVTFTGEVPAGKVRFIRIAYQDAGNDVVKEQFFTD